MRKGQALAVLLGLICLLGMGVVARGQETPTPAPSPPPAAPTPFSWYLPEPPKKLSLCGEKVPLENPAVYEMLDREFTIAVHDQAQVVMWMKRAGRYFPYIEKRLKAAGLPDDLKYLCVAESALLLKVNSVAGASGPWQFMPGTAKPYGLRVDRWIDERNNLPKSTDAAIAYLKDLYQRFGSWQLAMASYNCGERRVGREMDEQEVRDYYNLYLPLETQRYLFRIMSAKIILSDPKKYGYHLSPERLYAPVPSETIPLDIPRPIYLAGLAKALGTTFRKLRDMNPEIRDRVLPEGKFDLVAPPGSLKAAGGSTRSVLARAAGARAVARDDPEEKKAEDTAKYYVVRSGDTLIHIAKRTGCKVVDLKKANNIKGAAIKPGQKLVIP